MRKQQMKSDWKTRQFRIYGNWEPKKFLKRRGDGAFSDIDTLWEEIHCQRCIEHMKQIGINLSHIHFHKGYGLEGEAESIREAIEWAKQLHENNIAVGVYIGTTFFREIFKHPKYDEMIMQNGRSGWSATQYFRDFWCYNSPITKEYLKRVIQVAIEEVKADVIHFDTSFSFYVDQLCHCKYCLKAFREFLRTEAPKLSKIAGYDDNPDILEPPPCGNLNHLSTLREVREPGLLAWVLFHAKSGYRAMKELTGYARKLKSDIFIFYNGSQGSGVTRFSYADMTFEKMKLVDMSCTEDCIENPVGITEDGMPVSRFRAYKMANQTKTRHCYYTVTKGHNNQLMLAESAAFNYMSLGFVETGMQKTHRVEDDADKQLIDYIIKNEHLFTQQRLLANIAVLHHHESMILNPFPGNLTPFVVEQMLFERHLPFTIISGDDLSNDRLLSSIDMLILPDCKCLSDREVSIIEKFVSSGKRLLSIGNTGIADEYNQYRPKWALKRIFQREKSFTELYVSYQEVAVALSQSIQNSRQADILDIRFNRGRAIHISRLNFNLPDADKLNTFAGHRWYYHPYWKPPHNAKQFISSVENLLCDCLHVDSDLPRYVGVEYYVTNNKTLRMHLVNFSYPKQSVYNKTLSIILPPLANGKCEITYFQLRNVKTETARVENNILNIRLPKFDLLLTVEICELGANKLLCAKEHLNKSVQQ